MKIAGMLYLTFSRTRERVIPRFYPCGGDSRDKITYFWSSLMTCSKSATSLDSSDLEDFYSNKLRIHMWLNVTDLPHLIKMRKTISVSTAMLQFQQDLDQLVFRCLSHLPSNRHQYQDMYLHGMFPLDDRIRPSLCHLHWLLFLQRLFQLDLCPHPSIVTSMGTSPSASVPAWRPPPSLGTQSSTNMNTAAMPSMPPAESLATQQQAGYVWDRVRTREGVIEWGSKQSGIVFTVEQFISQQQNDFARIKIHW